jgi:hypothetical protein
MEFSWLLLRLLHWHCCWCLALVQQSSYCSATRNRHKVQIWVKFLGCDVSDENQMAATSAAVAVLLVSGFGPTVRLLQLHPIHTHTQWGTMMWMSGVGGDNTCRLSSRCSGCAAGVWSWSDGQVTTVPQETDTRYNFLVAMSFNVVM